MNWSKLNVSHPLISNVINQWQLLLNENYPESIYHNYLKKHANLFLVDSINSYFAISKLKLGSEFELDFAIPYENYSHGLTWELIEIESPHTAPYTKGGLPSARLTEATQQIRNWKSWLQTSRSEAKKLFSLWCIRTERQPNFNYTIIIGTRKNSEKWLQERNQYSQESGINIRSFDYLTDCVKRRLYLDQVFLGSGTWDEENPDLRSKLANPFIEAFTDSQWKKFLREPDVHGPHFIANSCKTLISHWTVNSELSCKFNENHCTEHL